MLYFIDDFIGRDGLWKWSFFMQKGYKGKITKIRLFIVCNFIE